MPRARRLTELEGSVLGLVWSHQPCTPYQVRREFLESPSPHWSGSAGAIYPLMARLEAAGLLRSAPHATGARPGRHYRITPAGSRALRTWVGPPVQAVVAGTPPDPLRTRIPFLAALTPAERRSFLREAEAHMLRLLRDSEAHLAGGDVGGPWFEHMSRGAIAMQRGRIAWLRSVAPATRMPRAGAPRARRPARAGR